VLDIDVSDAEGLTLTLIVCSVLPGVKTQVSV